MSSPPSNLHVVASDKPYCAGIDNKCFALVTSSLVSTQLFTLIDVPFVRYELTKSYMGKFRPQSGEPLICEVALLQNDLRLIHLFPDFKMPDCEGLKLKGVKVTYRVSQISHCHPNNRCLSYL